MSPEKPKGGGSAVDSLRMDQEFQLQNLRRLAMNPEFESMCQYTNAYSNPAKRFQKDIVSYASTQDAFARTPRAYKESNTAVHATHGTEQASVHNKFVQQAAQPQTQNDNVIPAGLQNIGSNKVVNPGTWKMTTSPPRLFLTPRELGVSTPGTSDESSAGTRVSSGAFSLISGADDRLTATDNAIRIPRSVMVTDDPAWSDPNPNPGGIRPSYYVDESPTPAPRVGLLSKGSALLGRLRFANGYPHEDAQSNKSGDSDATDVQSQIMPLYDSMGKGNLYSKPSPAPSIAEETIKPRLRRRMPEPTPHGIVRSESYTTAQAKFQGPLEARYQQGLGHIANNVPYSGTNMVGMALATASGHAGPFAPGFGGNQASQPMAVPHTPALASPIVMTRSSPVPFRPGTAFSNFSSGNPTANLPARAHSMGGQSPQLTKLLTNFDGLSTATKMLDAEYFPFVETAREGGGPINHGVIKITNVPFEVGRNEVFAFLGRNSRVLHDQLEPIHIVMCRVTGKTLDIFVELQTPSDAARAVDRHLDNCAAGRPSKLGDRQVDVHLSDQAGLMKVLFPKAHAVQWVGNVPAVPEQTISPYQTFRGFISDEELTMMVKHVENPARCPFSRGCPERPFECLISTLKKFPWDKTKHITLRQRYRIFQTTYKFIDVLKRKVERGVYPVRLTTGLLKRLIAAAMTCPGFTVLQKADIANLVGLDSDRIREFGQPRFAERWRHQYSTSVKTGVPADLVEWYIGVIAQETKENLDARVSFRQRQEIQRLSSATDSYWGYFWLELNLPVAKALEGMTLFDIAEREFAIIEDILRRAAKKMAADRAIQQ